MKIRLAKKILNGGNKLYHRKFMKLRPPYTYIDKQGVEHTVFPSWHDIPLVVRAKRRMSSKGVYYYFSKENLLCK